MENARSSRKAARKGGYWVVSWLNSAPSTAEELQKWACRMTHSDPPDVAARDIVEAHELRRLITWASSTTGEQHVRHRRTIAMWSRRRARHIGSLPDLHAQVAKDYINTLAAGSHVIRCLGCGKWFVGDDRLMQQCQMCRYKDQDAEQSGGVEDTGPGI